MTGCPTGGAAYATAISLVASSEDTAVLNTVRRLAGRFRDGDAFEAFRALASSGSATMRARSMAFHGLILAEFPTLELVQPIYTVLPSGSEPCPGRLSVDRHQAFGKPLPADYRERIASTARSVAKSTTAPAGVRAAARCARDRIKPFVAPDVVPSSLLLNYVCGELFEVRNPNPDAADVQFTVNEKPARLTLHVPANSATRFTTLERGVVHLYYRGALVKVKQNGGTACPSTPPPA